MRTKTGYGFGGWMFLFAALEIIGLYGYVRLWFTHGFDGGIGMGTLIALWGVYSIVALYNEKTYALSLTQSYLAVGVIYSAISMFMAILAHAPYRMAVLPELANALWAGIWLGYFKKSERVRMTYDSSPISWKWVGIITLGLLLTRFVL